MPDDGEAIRVWSRQEIEAAAAVEPEISSMIKTRISMRLLKLLIDYAAERGDYIEIISARGDLENAELHFFRRG